MTVPDGRKVFVPASMIDCVVSRGLDLLMMGTVFCAVVAPIMVIVAFVGLQHMLEPGNQSGTDGFVETLAVGGLAAVCWEPVCQSTRRRTFGRTTVDIELRDAANPHLYASTVRVLGRYAISVVTCCACVGLSFAVAPAAGMGLTPWRVVALIVVPCALVWLSVLLSALFRVDRRGWHDMLAGTVLVSTFAASARPGSGCGPSGDVVDGSCAGR